MNKFRIACTAAAWATLFALPAAADEYDQYYVRVSIDQIKAGYQRGKSPDHDYLTLYATSTRDPASRVTTGPIDIGTFSTNTLSTPSPNIMTDELLVSGRDTIQIYADIQNKSHTDPSKAVSDGLKIAGATIAVLGAGELLAAALSSPGGYQTFVTKEGSITALAGTVLALGGEVIGDVGGWLGLSEPDCDGPVFAPKLPVGKNVGEFMGRFPGPIPLNTPLGLLLWSDDSQMNGDGCGHAPSATIRVNFVLTRPPIQAPQFNSFGPPTHFKPIASGIRADRLIGTTWSDHSFIEGSRVLVTAKPADSFHRTTGPSGLQNFQLLQKRNPQLLELVGHPPSARSAVSGIVPSVTFNVQESPVSIPKDAIQISGASSAIPMQVNAFSGNRFASTSAVSGISRQVVRIKTKVAVTSDNATVHRSKVPYTLMPTKGSLSFADSFMLPNYVTLQVYGAYDAQERFVGSRLRYLRMDSAGNVVTDAMLEPAQHVPR